MRVIMNTMNSIMVYGANQELLGWRCVSCNRLFMNDMRIGWQEDTLCPDCRKDFIEKHSINQSTRDLLLEDYGIEF